MTCNHTYQLNHSCYGLKMIIYSKKSLKNLPQPWGIKKKWNLIKNISGVRKGQPRTKTGLAEKDVKSNGQPMPPGYDRFESFGHDDVDGIKILEKDDQAAKHCFLS